MIKLLIVLLGLLATSAFADMAMGMGMGTGAPGEPTDMRPFAHLFPYKNNTGQGPDLWVNLTNPAQHTWALHIYPTQQNGVLILNDATFDRAVSDFKYLLVNFWHSNCTTWCRNFEPYWFEAHSNIQNTTNFNIRWAQLDMQYNTHIQKKYNITHHPEQFLFVHNYPGGYIEYPGKKNAVDLEKWLRTEIPTLRAEGY